ncbi:MAG: choice-of-anchor J domain-containing protein, partial [Clostridia bacterium]|nr:choice-of-anchor J domain-containing protein [Clostridia bacterium]
LLSMLLAFALVFGLLPTAAFAITADEMANAPELVLGENTVEVTTASQQAYYKFIPPATDKYVLTSYSGDDPRGYLYDSNGSLLASHDDISYGTNNNFRLEYTLTGGETYYYGVYLWNSATGSFTVTLERVHNYVLSSTTSTCQELGTDTYTCTTCGDSYTEPATALADHDDTIVSNNDGTHTMTCSVCSRVETEDCTYETVSEGGVAQHTCTKCGYSYSEAVDEPELIQGWYFESDDELTGWTMLDLDGDNYTWERYGSNAYEGSGCIRVHWNENGADNWAISPAVDLRGCENATLSIWSRRQSTSYPDRFELYAGTSADPDQMTKVLDETTPSTSYENFTADISAFAGESAVYIAIRHHTTEDSFYLYADQVEITTLRPADCDHHLELMPASPATCTAAGNSQPYYKCTECGRLFHDAEGTQPALTSDIMDIPALGHNWGEWEETTEATCTTAGELTRTCSRCGETETQAIAALGHAWGEWEDVTPATCTEAGEQQRTCSRCNETETQTVAALGHNWGAAVSNNDGTHTYTCGRCSETETEDCTFDQHVEGGVVTNTCTECGYSVSEQAIGELTVDTWDFEEGSTGWTLLDVDGDGYAWYWNNEGLGHEGSVGMIFSFSYYNNVGALTPDNWAISPAFSLEGTVEASVSLWVRDYGYTENFAIFAGTSADPDQMIAVSEDFTTTSEYAQYTADLTEFCGESEVYIAVRHYNCTDGYYIFVDDVAITATFAAECEPGHHNLYHEEATEATCTEPGYAEYWYCDICGRYFTDAEGTNAVSFSSLMTSPALGHDWGDPADHNDGTHIYTCDRCGATYSEACGHFKTVAFNLMSEVCPICGHVFGENNVYGEQTAIGWYFEEAYEVADWAFIDANGDGFTWVWDTDPKMVAYEGEGKICSPSYDKPTQTALTPDNWAISPAFSLDIGCRNPMLSLWARGQDSTYYNEVFAVYAGTTPNPADMVKMTDDITTDNNYQNVTVDLSDYLGEETVYIAIRHYNCVDMFWLNVDNVEIVAEFPYLVAVDEAIENGAVTPDKELAFAGDTVTLTVEPDTGYVLETLTVTDVNGDPVEVTDNTFVMPASNVTVTATFVKGTLSDGYYLIGQNGWTADDIDLAQQFTVNPENANEYMLETTLAEGDTIKVVRVADGAIAQWYPDPGDNYTVAADYAGSVTIYFKTTYDNAWSAFGGHIWIVKKAPSFATQSLILSGQIGLSFNMDLPDIEGVDWTESYMTFTIPHGTCTERANYMDTRAKKSGNRGFVCYVNAIQMAEPITATFHWMQGGEEKTIEKTYAIKDYFFAYDGKKDSFSEPVQKLIESTADYGHYVQAFLADARGWTLGTDYAEMDKFYTESYDYENTATALDYYGDFTCENNGADIRNLSFTTVFDSATAVRILITPTSGYTGELMAAESGGKALNVSKEGKRYAVVIPNLAAHELSKTYTITVTTDGGTATITVSALSYVKLLFNANETALTRDAASAILGYATAAYNLNNQN